MYIRLTFYLSFCDGVPVFSGIVYTSEQDTREVYGFFSPKAPKPVPRAFPSYFLFPLLSGGSLVQTQMLMCLAMVLNIRTCAKYGPPNHLYVGLEAASLQWMLTWRFMIHLIDLLK